MMRNRLMQTMGAGGARHLRVALTLAVAGALLSGCSGGVSNLLGPAPAPEALPSISDRYAQLFGSKSQAVGEATPAAGGNELSCPPVNIRAGASTFAVAVPGKQPVGNDLRYQATITRTARDCQRIGDQITARIGIQGRVIAGPAGNPPTVEIPLRVAVVQGGVQEKTITTKVFRTTVAFSDASSVPFSLVAEDVTYPVPPGAIADSYIFYIGFDPQALTPEPPVVARKKK
jgi:hypothetical protein